jgi:hypothetical protein
MEEKLKVILRYNNNNNNNNTTTTTAISLLLLLLISMSLPQLLTMIVELILFLGV